ncbi:hypothetical protein EUTSA_v10011675mg [Eutrema salsugineum]|uniref:HMG box domain-containing protein n=1 Tax=Eutrema salsugineum TaxID=72664 RepID=V4JWQ7_EUTSA|nr:high mobility group B protein 10 [Eutrema salsugineum]ESQ29900.1 hypothetical protein EUTSA_v10011675mg [Eutrema salsugineum]
MSTEISQHSQFQLVPAYGSSSSDSKSIDVSSPAATYEDLVRNSDLFWDKLRDFLGYSDRTLKIPIVGGNRLDLHRLFVEVTSRGGIEQVIKDRKCKEVIGTFNFKMTNAAFVLKKYYLKMLFEFEHVYFFQEPISSFSAREEAVKRLVEKSAHHDKDTEELQPGCPVNGIIDGKFKDGYFVTMKMGSEELKGVLYHIPETCVETRRRKKKSKSSQMDSRRPKFHRSGYNFFFSEQYKRLKHEYAGRERFLIKEIGNLWSNLSESDRKVYQDKGLEDVERYRTEMSEYKSFIESCAAESAAATDAAENVAEPGL